jgi:NAD-dependent SIR2 family protein deacetylase
VRYHGSPEIHRCWTCFGEGYVVKVSPHTGRKTVVPCPACEDRRLIREHKEKLREESK